MKLDELDTEALKAGYTFHSDDSCYECNVCGKIFDVGEVFPIENRFFEASRAIKMHMKKEHGDRMEYFLAMDSKYVTLTDNQRELLHLIHCGLSDKEIASKLGVSPSTVRHQKFMFREKYKQAKMYIAIYELAIEEQKLNKEEILPMHDNAKMVDDRYVTTKEESEKTLVSMFESLSPLKLKVFPAKEKKKIVVLQKIANEFEKGKHYSEKEINEVLKDIYEDFATIRRYLIEYGFLDRTKDCKDYWVK